MLGGCWRWYRVLACPHRCQVPAHSRNQLWSTPCRRSFACVSRYCSIMSSLLAIS
jgi:hypothetical protein